MSFIQTTIQPFSKMLSNVEKWLDLAEESAKARGFDAEVLLACRLAPDQMTLLRQVQMVCDTAKFTAAYASNKQAPSHPDTEKTLPEVRARLATAQAYLSTFSAPDFEGYEQRTVSPGWLRGASITLPNYLSEFGVPNFYFHATTIYSILRHNGVALGKLSYLGGLTLLP